MDCVQFVLLVVAVVASAGATNLQPCHREDIHCTNNLHQVIARGFPEFGIPSVDTIIIPELKIRNSGLTLQNLVVSGIGNQHLNTFRKLPDGRSVLMSYITDLVINADVILDEPSQNPWHPIRKTGQYAANANTFEHIILPYDIVLDGHGVEHYSINEPIIMGGVHRMRDARLKLNAHYGAETGLAHFAHIADEQVISQIVEKAYESMVHNIRSVTKILPRRAFFQNL